MFTNMLNYWKRLKNKFLNWKNVAVEYDFDANCCYCGEFLARVKTGNLPMNCEKPFITFWGPKVNVPKLTIVLCDGCFEGNVDDFTKNKLSHSGSCRHDLVFELFKCVFCDKYHEQYQMSKIQRYNSQTTRVNTIEICNECYFPMYETVKSNTDISIFLPEHNPNKHTKGNYY